MNMIEKYYPLTRNDDRSTHKNLELSAFHKIHNVIVLLRERECPPLLSL